MNFFDIFFVHRKEKLGEYHLGRCKQLTTTTSTFPTVGDRKAPVDYIPAELDERELFSDENTIQTGEHFDHLFNDSDERLKAAVVSDIEDIQRYVIRLGIFR